METEMRLYMLDTNMASYIIKGEPVAARERLIKIPMSRICISAITQAELLRGVARKPEARHLPMAVNEFLLRVDILPWDSEAAQTYARLRTVCEREGISVGTMDMLIAAHSVAVDAVLVTHDRIFSRIAHHMAIEDWVE